MARKIVQGDSYWKDFTSPDVSSFDANWSGSWAISATVGGTALASGALTKSTDLSTFYLRVPPASTAGLTAGNYFLIVQIENSTIGYRKEVQQEAITIVTQGISP